MIFYQFVLEKLTAELAMCSVGTESSGNAMSAFAAAALFLNLAALTGVRSVSPEALLDTDQHVGEGPY